MYALYKEEQGEQAVSEWKYRQVFNSSFNLTFGRYELTIVYNTAYTYSCVCTIFTEGQYCGLSVVLHCVYSYIMSVPTPYRPKSDTCKTCDALSARIAAATEESERSVLESQLHLHHCKAERA